MGNTAHAHPNTLMFAVRSKRKEGVKEAAHLTSPAYPPPQKKLNAAELDSSDKSLSCSSEKNGLWQKHKYMLKCRRMQNEALCKHNGVGTHMDG